MRVFLRRDHGCVVHERVMLGDVSIVSARQARWEWIPHSSDSEITRRLEGQDAKDDRLYKKRSVAECYMLGDGM